MNDTVYMLMKVSRPQINSQNVPQNRSRPLWPLDGPKGPTDRAQGCSPP